ELARLAGSSSIDELRIKYTKLNAFQRFIANLSAKTTTTTAQALGSMRSRFGTDSRSVIYPNLILYVSILLTLSTIGLTANFNHISNQIAELKTLEKFHYWAKVDEARRSFSYYLVNSKPLEPGARVDEDKAYMELQTLMTNLRDVADGLVVISGQLVSIVNID